MSFKFFKNCILFIYLVYCAGTCMPWYMCLGQRNLRQTVLSFQYVSSGDWIWSWDLTASALAYWAIFPTPLGELLKGPAQHRCWKLYCICRCNTSVSVFVCHNMQSQRLHWPVELGLRYILLSKCFRLHKIFTSRDSKHSKQNEQL